MAVFFFMLQLCDIELLVGSESVSSHKVVLAAVSPYFSAMFLSKLQCAATLN